MRHRHILPLVLLAGATACKDAPLTPRTPSAPDEPRYATTGGGATDIRAGYGYVCLLRGGRIVCLGENDEGQPIGTHTAATGSFVQLTAGRTHACGLRSDGAVECFGANDFGEAPPLKRAPTGSFRFVSAGLSHTCAVRTDGSLECWGSNAHGEAPPVWAPQTGTFTEVAANSNRTCAMRNDGVVECRGFHLGSPSVRVSPSGSYVMLAQSVGITFCVLRNSGLPECWGDQPNLGSGSFLELVVGGTHECALRSDGIAVCGGYPYSWNGPQERTVTGREEGKVTGARWTRITAGSYHTCGLRPDGYFECFGSQTIGSNSPDVTPAAEPPKAWLRWGRMRIDFRDINSNELRTDIERSLANGDGSWTRVGTVGANREWFTDSTATAGATYVYRIRACNNAGCSYWELSNEARFPAAAPPAPKVTAAGYVCGFASCARVAWTVDNTFVDTFRIQRSVNTGPRYGPWENMPPQSRSTTAFDNYGLTPGARYLYRVAACNIRGCSAYVTSNPFVAPMPPPPHAPADLTADMLFNHMHLVWGDVANETTYELQRREYNGTAWSPWSEPVVRTMNETSDDQAVVPGTLYQWRIRACNQGGCSAYTYSAPTRA
ncbi:MAG TPA: hypothetical protein VGO40_09135 [Longimicrobium sp.]|jgi:hypothetical protein|nr:hypothetical protein [Longimicrobium sp.]